MSKSKKHTVLISGSQGRMGRELCAILNDHPKLKLGASVDKNEIKAFDARHTAVLKPTQASLNAVLAASDVVIDFSTPSGTKALVEAMKTTSEKSILIGTTGLDEKIQQAIRKIAKDCGHRVLVAGNTSIGVFQMARLAFEAARSLHPLGFDVEITETHHRMKVDAPSGTALLLANVIKQALPRSEIVFNRTGARKANSIGIQSVRGGGVFGEHEIRFLSDHEEVRLSHRAFSRTLFANGAINLALDVEKKIKSGQVVALQDFILKS